MCPVTEEAAEVWAVDDRRILLRRGYVLEAATGKALENAVLRTEARVTLIDGLLACAVLAGLVLNALLGLWWADPAAGYVLLGYGLKEATTIFREHT